MGSVPIDIERALRAFESRFGSKLNWYEIVRRSAGCRGTSTRSRTTGSEATAPICPPPGEILHNLAIYGWDLRDTLA